MGGAEEEKDDRVYSGEEDDEQPQPQPQPQQQQSDSDQKGEEEEDDDSGSESGSKSTPQAVTKPQPDPSTSKLKLKRPAPPPQVPDPNNNNKKPKNAQQDSPVKKQYFKRLWSEEDEVIILNAIPLFAADPFSDINSFHNSIKPSLHVDVTNAQLADKLRKLKKKCVKNLVKQENGKSLSTPHEELCFSLSKNIWGENTNTTNLPKTAKKVGPGPGPTNVDSDFKQFFSVGSHGRLLDSADQLIKNGWKHVSASKRSEWENKCDKLMVDQVDLYSRIFGLMHEQAKLVSEAMKSAQE